MTQSDTDLEEMCMCGGPMDGSGCDNHYPTSQTMIDIADKLMEFKAPSDSDFITECEANSPKLDVPTEDSNAVLAAQQKIFIKFQNEYLPRLLELAKQGKELEKKVEELEGGIREYQQTENITIQRLERQVQELEKQIYRDIESGCFELRHIDD